MPLTQPRVILLAHLSAFGIVAGATIAAEVVTSAAFRIRENTALVLDAVREQQALAQQIAVLASKAADGGRSSELRYGQIVGRFSRLHEQLRRADDAPGGLTFPSGPSPSASFSAFYGGGSQPLASMVDGFLAKVRAVDGAPADDPKILADRREIVQFASETFPAALDQAVRAMSRSSLKDVQSLRQARLILVLLALATLAVEAFLVGRSILGGAASRARRLATSGPTDSDLGVLSPERFTERSLTEIARAHRYKRPISVLTIAAERPVDRQDAAKRPHEWDSRRDVCNDLSRTLRPSDFIGVSDDGLFLVILPETDIYAADLTAHRLLRELTKRPPTRPGQGPPLTITVGVAQIYPDETQVEMALERARSAIRQGQGQGPDAGQVFVGTRR